MFLTAFLLGCADPGTVALDEDFGTWSLVWSDEFDGAAGAPIDTSIWTHDVGGDGWGNEQLEYNTDRTDNVRLSGDGFLEIVALQENYESNSYTSGRIKTEGGYEQGYGRYEARIKMPAGKGLWPAFWMLGANFSEVGWPTCGEVDIMEYRGDNTYTAHGTVHGPGYSGGEGIGTSYVLPEGTFSDDYHTFAVEIDPEHIAWYVDDNLYQRLTPGDLPEGTPWVFSAEQFLILNLAVGGSFLENPDETTAFPATLSVDYVRAYERVE